MQFISGPSVQLEWNCSIRQQPASGRIDFVARMGVIVQVEMIRWPELHIFKLFHWPSHRSEPL